jgi:hypothetical protein
MSPRVPAADAVTCHRDGKAASCHRTPTICRFNCQREVPRLLRELHTIHLPSFRILDTESPAAITQEVSIVFRTQES